MRTTMGEGAWPVGLSILLACGSPTTSPSPTAPVLPPPAVAGSAPAAPQPPPASPPAADGGLTPEQAAALAAQADAMQMQMLASIDGKLVVVGTTPPAPAPAAPASTSSTSTSTKVEGPKGDVQIGAIGMTEPVVDGLRVMAGQRARLRACYVRGLNADPTMSGKLVVVIKVAPNGEVSSADIASNTGLSPGVASCVVSLAKRLQFDGAGSKGSTLTAPLTFVQSR